MRLFVLDASVAVKWYLPSAGEPFSEQAKLVREMVLLGDDKFIAPDLLWVEFGNVMWRSVRRGRLTAEEAKLGVDAFAKMTILNVPSHPIIPIALDLAISSNCTVYDCLYVTLAMESSAQLITADEQLFQSLHAVAPVKWIGSIL